MFSEGLPNPVFDLTGEVDHHQRIQENTSAESTKGYRLANAVD